MKVFKETGTKRGRLLEKKRQGVLSSLKQVAALFFYSSILMAGPSVAAEDPIPNRYLADSPWPTVHRNGYKQASTPFRGPEPGDNLLIDYMKSPFGTASPWYHYSERYATGERAIWGSNITHVYKVLPTQTGIKMLASYQIDDSRFSNLHWTHILLAGNRLITHNLTENRTRRWLLKFGDDLSDPKSPITKLAEFEFPEDVKGRVAFFDLLHDGRLVFYSEGGQVGTLTTTFEELTYISLEGAAGEVFGHNHFALDEHNYIYLYTTHRMYRINCNGSKPRLDWKVDYDFVGQSGIGGGTTPTLMGMGSQDKLVFVVDNHTPKAHFVAFWREEIPSDWKGLPGYDRRIAAIKEIMAGPPGGSFFGLPYAAGECSPTCRGYDIAVAQNNGFAYFNHPCPTVKGVQKFRWNPSTRSLDQVWENKTLNLNGVLTYSEGSNIVYSSGRNDRTCAFHFYGLDWDTGKVVIDKPMANSKDFFDGGCTALIGDFDRRCIFSTETGIVQIRVENVNPGNH